jgi:hypothetical protein
MKKTLLGSLLALAVLLATGCQSGGPFAGGSAGVTYDPATGAVGGQISVTFKDRAGNPRTVTAVRHAASRGYDAAGNFVTLNAIRDVAVRAYKSGQSAVTLARAAGLNDFDQGTAAIIAASLASYNADPASL